jgi:hypothetical protein
VSRRQPFVWRLWLPLLLLAGTPSAAQQILVDRGLRAAELWCFPLESDPRTYVYLPASARLATDAAGRPEFSFVRYVVPAGSAGADAAADGSARATITQAAGGGILHFLVLLETPPTMVESAQASLRKTLKDDEIVLRGPIVFADGRYALVSSILKPSGTGTEKALVAGGRAPVLEGNRLALSFELDAVHASLLLESFRMATPDVSLVFDMSFGGLTEAYDAELTIDWSEVRKSEGFSAGGTIYFVSADVEAKFDELFRNNAIRLRSSGTDSTMEALLETVYNKLLELLFKPVEAERIPEDQRAGLTQALSALTDSRGGPLSSRKTTGFGLYGGYQVKEMRSSGMSRLDFNHRATVERHAFITLNVGDVHRRFGADPAFFRDVNLEDPTFLQREVQVGIDGALLRDFEGYINSVTVTMRKLHAGGKQTVREIVLDRETYKKSGSDLRLAYGWDGDSDRMQWLSYDYRMAWSFKGGGAHESPWTTSQTPMIELFSPFERRTVAVVGNLRTLAASGVRAVVVQIEYPFFDGRRRRQVVIKTDEPESEHEVEITLPLNEFGYDYTITWQLEGNRRLTSRGKDSSGLVFIDELPQQGASPGGGGSPSAAAGVGAAPTEEEG